MAITDSNNGFDANQNQSFAGQPPAPQPTTSDVPNQIPAIPSASQPQTPAAPQATQPTAQPRPAVPAPVPTAQPSKQGLHSAIFDGVLKTLGGGTQYINKTDPQTGEVTRVPIQQSRGQLGKSILAGAIAGMFGGMGARDEQGRHDPVKAAQEGFVAGQQPMAKKVGELQQTADEDTSRRQLTLKNNIDLMHQQIAMTHMKHQELDATADNNNKGILADADAFDKNLTGAEVNDPTKKAVQGRGLTYKEALDKLHGNWSNTLAIVDGSQEVRGPNGDMEVEPTYAVLNPNVTIKMSEEQAAALAQFKPQYQNAYQATGGNLRIPLNRYVSDVHQLNSLNQAEAFFENAKDQLGIKNTPDFAAIARQGGQPVLDAVKDVENAIGQGGDPVDALRRLAGTGGGAQILKALNITNDQVNDLVNERDRKAALAKTGGLGDKSIMPDAIAALQKNGAALHLSPAELENAIGKVPPQGFTVGEYREASNRLQAQANSNREFEQKSGKPADIDTLSDQLLQPNNLMTIKNIGGRGTEGTAIVAEAARKAKERGIPFDPGVINERVNFAQKYFDPNGKDSGNRRSLNNLVQHTASLAGLDHGAQYSKAANTVLNGIESQFGSEAYQEFLTEVNIVKDEASIYFAGGYAPTQEQQAMWKKVLSDNATPNQVEAFVKTIIPMAAVRLNSTANQFKEVMGYDDPNLVYPETKDAAAKLGLSKSLAKFQSGGTLGQKTPNPTQQTPEQVKQQKLQAITLPGGGHPADIAYSPDGKTTLVFSGKAGDPWLDLATGKPYVAPTR